MSSSSVSGPSSPSSTEAVCSAKGCRAPAAWALRWNNPRIHAPDRRKTWLACEEHRAHLSRFLDTRGFLRETEPFDAFGPQAQPDA